jgi:hypothetical protein
MEIHKLSSGISPPIVVDVNRDGLNDMVFVNNAKSKIDILLQRRNWKPGAEPAIDAGKDDINDVFGIEANWRFARTGYALDVAAMALAVEDVNGDSLPDLVYFGKGAVWVVLQEKAPATAPAATAPADKPSEPRWQVARKIEVEGQPGNHPLDIGDLNGDKLPDIAMLGAESVWVVLQNKDNTFAQPVKYPTGSQRLRELRLADLNRDGACDLLVLCGEQDNPLRVRFQNAKGQLGPEVRLDMPMPTAFDVSDLGAKGRCHVLSVAAQSGRLSVMALAPNPVKEDFPVFTYPLPSAEAAGDRDVIAADVNGDGLLDVVASDPGRAEFLLLLAAPKDMPAPPQRLPGMQDMRKLAVAASPTGDAVVALSVKEKLIGVSRFEKGRLSYPAALPITGEPLAMQVSDVDDDRKPDVVYVAKDKGKDKYVLRTLLDILAAEPKPGPELELAELTDKPQDMLAGDVDGDGGPEFMVLRPYGAMLLIRRQEGKLVEVAAKDLNGGLVSNLVPSSVSLAPLGPNGATALLVAQKDFARSLVFDSAKGWRVVDQYAAPNARSSLATATSIALSEGAQTLFTYDAARGRLVSMDRAQDGTYQVKSELEIGQMVATRMFAGNFGGAMPVSIVVAGPHKVVVVPVAAPTQVLRKIAGYEGDTDKDGRPSLLTVGDLNADGLADLVLVEQNKHQVQILSFDSGGSLVAGLKFKVFEEMRADRRDYYYGAREAGEPRSAVVGDVTGDRKNDLILVVHDRLIVYPQD